MKLRLYSGGRFRNAMIYIDGNIYKDTFSTAEKTAIYEIWLHVAEDYLPFGANITTVEPANESFLYVRAQRVVIGGGAIYNVKDSTARITQSLLR